MVEFEGVEFCLVKHGEYHILLRRQSGDQKFFPERIQRVIV